MIAALGRRPKRHGCTLRSCALVSVRPDQAMPDRIAIAPRIARRLALALPLLGSIAACAPGPSPEMARASPASARAETQETPICRPDPALFTPQTAPDCKFGRAELKTLDPEQWARLKVEYERQCYQRAETDVRERLRLLQTASKC